MTTSDDQLDARIRASEVAATPTSEHLDQMWATVLQRLDDQPTTLIPQRVSRRRPFRVALASAGAAAVAVAVALSPFGASSDHPVVPGPAAAQALERAAEAAGAVDWTPLSTTDYHHTMSTDFMPTIPSRNGDTDRFNELPPGPASSTEVFLDANGRGIRLDVSGGTDRNIYPMPSKPDRHGRISGFSWKGDRTLHESAADSLRYADMVSVTTWPRSGGRPTYRLWYRTPDGFKTGAAMPGSAIPRQGLDLGQRFQRDRWGAPLSALERLNEASAEQIDGLLDPILGERPDGEIAVVGPIVGGPYNETVKWFSAQIEVQRAVKLLGSAPIAPSVRSALFRRLAAQSHATVKRGVQDELGRTGTRITFEWLLDERVPKFTMTKEQLREDAIAKQQPAAGSIAGPELVRVPAHRSVGRWYSSIVIDESTGTILQQEEYSDWKTTKPVPRVVTTTRRAQPIDGIGWHLGIKLEPGWYGTIDAETFGVLERTSSITNLRTAACATTPRMCG